MPELPEVETVRKTLQEFLPGLTIEHVRVSLPRIIKYPEVEEFVHVIKGRSFREICRRGKYLLVRLSGNYSLVIHLRMTGQLRYANPDDAMPKHTHVIFELSDGKELRYTDMRQFGTMYLAPDQDIEQVSGMHKLGWEPLEDFPLEGFRELLSRRSTKIKNLLLDQRLVAGIGNIYADESLFAAGVHPERAANTLKSEEVECLHAELIKILQKGVAMRGTSFSDYVDGLGKSGEFQHQLNVYGREGEPCKLCGAMIVRRKIAGRSAHICPWCQTEEA